MYYAAFYDEQNFIDLYDVMDALAKGEKINLPLPVSDLKIKCIFTSDKNLRKRMLIYLYYLRKYYIVMDEVIFPNDQNTKCTQAYVAKIKQITGEENDYLSMRKYENKANWKRNKDLFFEGDVPKYNCFINAMTRLFFCLGCNDYNTFDNLYRFVSSTVREDYQNTKDKKIKATQCETITAQLKNDSEVQSLLREARLYSMEVYINQHKLFKEAYELQTNVIDPPTTFMQLSFAKDALLKYICQYYYDLGENEKKRNRGVSRSSQLEINRKIFNGKIGGFSINKSSAHTHCKTCGHKSNYIYDIIAYAPYEFPLISVCPSCFEDATYQLIRMFSGKFSNYVISNQIRVTYKNYFAPHGRCSCCRRTTKARFEIESVRNQRIDLCNDCYGKLTNNASQKLKRLHKQGM